MSTHSLDDEAVGVAVIGMAGRFPGAPDLERFWRNLRNGVESIRDFTPEELTQAGVTDEMLADRSYIRRGTSLDKVEEFDAAFFGYSASDAALTDPQQRLFLECAWEAMESAGYDSKSYRGAVGVFGGSNVNEYVLRNIAPNHADFDDLSVVVGLDKDYLTTRVSYKLDLHGPSVVVQSACSTSLVAIHYGVDALMSGQCDMALAGGVSVQVPQTDGYYFRDGGIRSPDGHCRPFDEAAQGTVFGSGCGVVLLKRLADALRDGDHVLAVIKGSAVNNDGAAKVGYTAPSVDGQSQVVAEALSVAEVDPASIAFVEGHGTATPMGDPIEVAALSRAFALPASARGTCLLGSVKGNLGHLNTAAGVAAVIKTVLALQHREIPPTLHFRSPNPKLALDSTPFRVNAALTPWSSEGRPRRATVSGFGVGGTNACIVFEEAPELPASGSSRAVQILPLSARTSSALDSMTARLADFVSANPSVNLADASYTLALGRRPMARRRVIVAAGASALVDALAAKDRTRIVTGESAAKARSVVFMFTGQGSQYVNMGRGLYESESVFRDAVDRGAEVLRPALGLDLRDVLYPRDGQSDEATARLTATALAQPALFVIEYAMAQLVMSWGVTPAAMIGHSIGEYVAACLAGVFSFEDALTLVALRGRLMNALPAGSMLAVPLPLAEVEADITPEISVAALNAPALTVLSGPHAAIDALEARLKERGTPGRRLHTSHAFHSAMMDPILPEFTAAVAAVRRKAPTIPYLSNLSGTWITDAEVLDPTYWANHLRGAVRFSDGLTELLKTDDRVFLELGPGETLATLARRRSDRQASHVMVSSIRAPRDPIGDLDRVLVAVGELWAAGVDVDWTAYFAGERRRRIPLPTYPFERKRHWIDPPKPGAVTASRPRRAPKTARRGFDDWFSVPVWTSAALLPDRAAGAVASGPWLVLGDDDGFGRGLEEELVRLGQDVIAVRVGAQPTGGDRTYVVRPDRPEDYAGLLTALRGAGRWPRHIVHAWGTAGGAVGSKTRDEFYSLLALAQALGTVGSEQPVRLSVITAGALDVIGGDASRPERATVLGPVRTIPLEYGHVACQLIDVVAGADLSRTARAVVREITARTADLIVAYRDGRRWVQSYQPVRLTQVPERPHLRPGGAYLVTGGWGGLGLAIAEHLARTAQAKLALVGRSGLPERASWASWLAGHASSDATSQRIRAAMSLEALGASVLPIAADVSDAAAARGAVEQALRAFGALHGVVHAAGVPGGGVIQLKTPDAASAVLAPKVAGTWALDRALDGVDLDWMMLCSSTYAVESAIGQVDYSAANSFLDAFAAYRTSRGKPTVSVNWDGWEEVGMAAVALQARATRQDAGRTHPLLGQLISGATDRLVYRSEVRAESDWTLIEHRVSGLAAVPGTAYLDMVLAAMTEKTGGADVEFRDVIFSGPLSVGPSESRGLFTVLDPAESGYRFVVLSRARTASGPEWRTHAQGVVQVQPAARSTLDEAAIGQLSAAPLPVLPGAEPGALVYWGPRWHVVQKLSSGPERIYLELRLPEAFADDLAGRPLHPALLDVATGLGCLSLGGGADYLPLSYERVSVAGRLVAELRVDVRVARRSDADGLLTLDVTIADRAGQVLVSVDRFTLKRVEKASRPSPARPGVLSAQQAAAYEPLAALAGPAPGASGIDPARGIEAFDRILSHGLPQVIVSPRWLSILPTTVDVDVADEPSGAPAADAEPQATVSETAPATSDRPELDSAYVAPRTEYELALVEVWQEALGYGRIGVEDNFFELGGDSVIAIQIASKAAKRLKVELPLNRLFEAPTIAELVRSLGPSAPLEPRPEPVEPKAAVPVAVAPRPAAAAPAEVAAPVADTGGSTAAPGPVRHDPKTTTERRLLHIWRTVLGIDEPGIDRSLLAIPGGADKLDALLAEVRKAFGHLSEGIPIQEFRNHPTIESLARLIDASGVVHPSVVVAIQPKGPRRPLFLIHGGGGYVFFFRALASRLGLTRPLYAVRAELKSDKWGRPFDKARSIEELAARYVEEVRRVQPEGPYLLGGACLGGVIAFEMAHQLERAGESVAAPILLFDPFVLNNPNVRQMHAHPEHSRHVYMQRRVAAHLGQSSQLGRGAGIRYLAVKIVKNLPDLAIAAGAAVDTLFKRTRHALGAAATDLSWNAGRLIGRPVPADRVVARQWDINMRKTWELLTRYTPKAFDGKLVLFRAEVNPDPESGWTGLARRGLIVHPTPGGHLDMLDEPEVARTAELVVRYLDASETAVRRVADVPEAVSQ